MSEKREPFLVACKPCGHVWPAFWLPMPIKEATAFMKGACPKCAGDSMQVYLASPEQAATWEYENASRPIASPK